MHDGLNELLQLDIDHAYMSFDEILEAVILYTEHVHYRWLTSEDNPDPIEREGYKRLVRERYDQLNGHPLPDRSQPHPHVGCCGQILPG